MVQKSKGKNLLTETLSKTSVSEIPYKETKSTSDDNIKRASPTVSSFIKVIFWISICILTVFIFYIYFFAPSQNRLNPIYVNPSPKIPAPLPSSVLDYDTPSVSSAKEQGLLSSPSSTFDDVSYPAASSPECLEKETQKIEEMEKELNSLKERQNQKIIDSLFLYYLISTGRPYQKQLQKVLLNDPQNIFAIQVQQQLGSFGITGIPTLPQLQQFYVQEAKIVAYSFHTKEKTLSWTENIRVFFKSLIQIRPLVIQDKNLTGMNILYKAHDQLKEGQLQKMIDTLKNLPPEQYLLMTDFIQNASARITLDKIIKSLTHEERN